MNSKIFQLFSAVTAVVEAVVTGKGQGLTKRQIAVSAVATALEQGAKAGVFAAVPPKEELEQVNDAVVALQNAQGFSKIGAVGNVLSEIDDVIRLIKVSAEAVVAVKAASKPQA